MDRVAGLLADYVMQKGVAKEDEWELYKYGFLVALEMGTGFVLALLISIGFHMVPEGLLFFVIFIPLRSYAGGLHMAKYSHCLMLSLLTFSLVLLFSKLADVPAGFVFPAIIVLQVMVYKLYPVENANRDVDEEENAFFHRKLKKFLCLHFVLALAFGLLSLDKYMLVVFATYVLAASTMCVAKCRS